MSLPDSVVGAIVGAVIGFVGSILAQEYVLRRGKTEKTNERVYSHLYVEIDECLDKLANDDSPPDMEWVRITRQDHLGYLIEPSELYTDLKTFYATTCRDLRRQIKQCERYFSRNVKKDLERKVASSTEKPSSDPRSIATAIEEFSKIVGCNMYQGSASLVSAMVPRYYNYDIFKPLLFALPEPEDEPKPPANIIDEWTTKTKLNKYFGDWRDKAKVDSTVVEYRRIHALATSEAKHLREELAKKLGKKSKPEVKS